MAAVDLNLDPSNKQLRQFGLIALVALPFVGYLVAGKPAIGSWETSHWQIMGVASALGVLVGLAAWLRPALLKWIFIVLSLITFPIGFVLGEGIMLLIYGIAFVPTAMVFRLVRRDALQRGMDRQAASYWQPKSQPKDIKSYFRQS